MCLSSLKVELTCFGFLFSASSWVFSLELMVAFVSNLKCGRPSHFKTGLTSSIYIFPFRTTITVIYDWRFLPVQREFDPH